MMPEERGLAVFSSDRENRATWRDEGEKGMENG